MDTLAFEDIAPAVDTFCPPAPPDDANLEAAAEQLGDLGLDDEPAPPLSTDMPASLEPALWESPAM